MANEELVRKIRNKLEAWIEKNEKGLQPFGCAERLDSPMGDNVASIDSAANHYLNIAYKMVCEEMGVPYEPLKQGVRA